MSKPRVNLLLPMAGEGSRFAQEGFSKPKPFIDVAGKPMISWVIDNFDSDLVDLHYIFVIRKEHDERCRIKEQLLELLPAEKVDVVYADRLTEGAACTCLLAESLIDNEVPLVIANSDQFMEWNCSEFFSKCVLQPTAAGIDGSILTFFIPMENNDQKWSYAKLDEKGFVTEVREKEVISEHATVGVYHWAKGSDYVKAAKQMIEKDIRVKGEFYVCPVYNENIADGQKVVIFDCQKMWGLGVPADLEFFLQNYEPVKGAVIVK